MQLKFPVSLSLYVFISPVNHIFIAVNFHYVKNCKKDRGGAEERSSRGDHRGGLCAFLSLFLSPFPLLRSGTLQRKPLSGKKATDGVGEGNGKGEGRRRRRGEEEEVNAPAYCRPVYKQTF